MNLRIHITYLQKLFLANKGDWLLFDDVFLSKSACPFYAPYVFKGTVSFLNNRKQTVPLR